MTLPARVPEPPQTKTPTGAGAVDIGEVRDQRQIALKQRVLALLVTEIQQLESLFKSTDLQSKDRPMLLRRMAEDYVELENAAFREKTEAEITRDEYKATNPREAGKQQAIVNARKTTMERARKAAIADYTSLVTDYSGQPSPTSRTTRRPRTRCSTRSTTTSRTSTSSRATRPTRGACTSTSSRRRRTRSTSRTRTSRSGSCSSTRRMGDPTKWEPAKQAYIKVIAKPPPENKVYGYAWYKLAYVFWNQGDLPHALDAFKKTIDFGTQFAQLPNATKLAESARKDVVPVYALAGSPTDAYNFFKNLSGDAAGSNDKTFKMMDDLGQNYLDTGHYPEAIALYKDLEVRDSGERQGLRVPVAHHRSDDGDEVGRQDGHRRRS